MNETEVIRYEQFCQFKAEIRSSGDYLIVGIDVAKERHHILGDVLGDIL
jgi:hypothetical protein